VIIDDYNWKYAMTSLDTDRTVSFIRNDNNWEIKNVKGPVGGRDFVIIVYTDEIYKIATIIKNKVVVESRTPNRERARLITEAMIDNWVAP
jgi:hypothetical protein